jgi:hypothetical protein
MSYVYRRGGRFTVRAGLPCAESFVTFTFSQQLPPLSFHLLSLSPITLSFELFASPDEPFAALFLSLTDTELAIVPSVNNDLSAPNTPHWSKPGSLLPLVQLSLFEISCVLLRPDEFNGLEFRSIGLEFS